MPGKQSEVEEWSMGALEYDGFVPILQHSYALSYKSIIVTILLRYHDYLYPGCQCLAEGSLLV